MNIAARRGPRGQKEPNLVSKAIRQSAKGEECTINLPGCNHDTATTVFCHMRYFTWAGMGQKPPDILGFYACSNCHAEQERGNAGFDDLLRALGKTLLRLLAKGLITVKR